MTDCTFCSFSVILVVATISSLHQILNYFYRSPTGGMWAARILGQKAEISIPGNEEPIIVLDANILIRAVLGVKVRNLIQNHASDVLFFTPDLCYEDALKYLPILFEKRNLPPTDVLVGSIKDRAQDCSTPLS
jgi:PIN domain